MELIDIGVNLAHDSFDHDREDVIHRAYESGVTQLVVTGSSVGVSRDALHLAQQNPGRLFATAGIHPHHASDFDEHTVPALRQLLQHREVVAAGECGLDFFRNFSAPEEQEIAFRAQLELAAEAAVPVFLHQRDAHEALMAMLKPYRDRIPRGVAHCFTGTSAELTDCLDLDLYVGITGWICDERRGAHLRELVAKIPADRLLLETDAPYLLPRDLKPKPRTRRNEPMHLVHIAATVAACRDVSIEEVAAQITANARRFFDLPPYSA